VTMKLERIVKLAEVVLEWMRRLTIWSLRAVVGLVGVVTTETMALVWFVDGAASSAMRVVIEAATESRMAWL
jgi:hypothetical protein